LKGAIKLENSNYFTTGEVMDFIKFQSSSDLCIVARRMLADGENGVQLASSGEDITIVEGICNWLEEKRKRKATPNQTYNLRMFIAENLSHYGKFNDSKSATMVFHGLIYDED